MNEMNALKFPSSSQVGHEQNHLVSHTRELPTKFKNVAGTGILSDNINPGEIKNLHGTGESIGKE